MTEQEEQEEKDLASLKVFLEERIKGKIPEKLYNSARYSMYDESGVVDFSSWYFKLTIMYSEKEGYWWIIKSGKGDNAFGLKYYYFSIETESYDEFNEDEFFVDFEECYADSLTVEK